MDNVAMIVKLKSQPGKRAELLNAMKVLVDAAEGEEGTLLYVFSTADDDPDTVWAFELYRDAAALKAHQSSPAMAEAIGSFGALIGEAPEMMTVTPVMGKGM